MNINPAEVRRELDLWYGRLVENNAPEYVAVRMGEITEEEIRAQGIVSIILGKLRDDQRHTGRTPNDEILGVMLVEILDSTFGLDPNEIYATMVHIRRTLPKYKKMPEA